ncbi:MAG: hypothetical protein F7C35_07575 [Desulfurococcales archaeon]|nr:hypothetical protein [Desulfurococcales archaeon]
MGRKGVRFLLLVLLAASLYGSTLYGSSSKVWGSGDPLSVVGVVSRVGAEPVAADGLYVDVEGVSGIPSWEARIYSGGRLVSSLRVLCPPSAGIGDGGFFGGVELAGWWVDGSPPSYSWGSMRYLKIYGILRVVGGHVGAEGGASFTLESGLGYRFVGRIQWSTYGYDGFYPVMCPIVSISGGRMMVFLGNLSASSSYEIHIYGIEEGEELYNYTVSLDTSLLVLHAYYVGGDKALLTTLYKAYLVSPEGVLDRVDIDGTELKVYRVDVSGEEALIIGSGSNIYKVNNTGIHPVGQLYRLDLLQSLEGRRGAVLYGYYNVVLPEGLWFKALPLDYYWGPRTGFTGDVYSGGGFLLYNNWTVLLRYAAFTPDAEILENAGSGGPSPVYYEDSDYIAIPYTYFSMLLLQPPPRPQQYLNIDYMEGGASVEQIATLPSSPSYMAWGEGYLIVYYRDSGELRVYDSGGGLLATWNIDYDRPIGVLNGRFFYVSGGHLISLNLTGGDTVDHGSITPQWMPGDIEALESVVRGGRLLIPLYRPFGTPSGELISAVVGGGEVHYYSIPYQETLLADGSLLVLNRTLEKAYIVSLVDPMNGTVFWSMHIPRDLGSLYTFPSNTGVLMWAGPGGQGFMLLDPENDSIVLVPIPSTATPTPGSIHGNPAMIYNGWNDLYAVELTGITVDGRASIRVYHVTFPEETSYTGPFATAPDTVYVVAATSSGGTVVYKVTFGGD